MRTEGFPFGQGVDHAEVLLIRDAVLAAYDTARTPEMSTADLRQLTQALIQAELVAESRRRADHGVRSLTAAEEVALAKAVDNQINGVGRLQALLDVPDVEDIYIRGSCPVVLRMADKRVLLTDPIADTPEELFAQIQFLAAYHGSRERAFSPANPFLDMQLPDGSRLAAVCDNSPWPILTIRRHAYVDVTLDDLVGMAQRLSSMEWGYTAALQAFADDVDDSTGDDVAAALMLALDRQGGGVADVLRRLAAQLGREVRSRDEVEAERAQPRQALRVLMLMLAGLIVVSGFVPAISSAYSTVAGQLVMAALLAFAAVMLVRMRTLSLGKPAPRFLTGVRS